MTAESQRYDSADEASPVADRPPVDDASMDEPDDASAHEPDGATPAETVDTVETPTPEGSEELAEPKGPPAPDAPREQRASTEPSRVGTARDRITVQPRAGSPARIHVRVGDVVYEGDPRRLRRIGGRTPRIDAWKVVDITPETVVARHIDSGAEFDWDRAALETGLLTGRYAVDLVEFVSVGLRRNYPGRGRPKTVIATAYGNDGLRYVRRFIVLGDDGETVRLEPWTETPAVSALPDRLRKSLDRRIEEALEAESYRLE